MAQSRETPQTNAEEVAVAAIRKPKDLQIPIETDSGIQIAARPTRRSLTTGSLGTRYGLDANQAIEIPEGFDEQVELAVMLYVQEGIVKTVIDLMVDFSATKMRNICEQPKSQKFFDNLCRYSDMDSVIRWILLEYYRSGDVFTYRGDKQSMKKGPDRGAIFYPYTVLNPTMVEIEGSLMFNYNVYTLEVNAELRNLLAAVKNKDKRVAQVLKYIPKEFKNFDLSPAGNIILNQEKVGRLSKNRQPYEKRPTPFISGAFRPLLLKRRLREMDLAAAEGTINSLMVVKVGNDLYPATRKQLEAVASLFATGAKSYQLFWNHTIDIDVITADLSALSDEKYRQVNKDILSSLGMPSVLINGGEEGGRFANAWASIVALMERLENGRRQVKRWMESEYLRIAEENNIREVPTVEFERMNLREEKVYKNILMALYDRGLLDAESLLEDSGYEYDQIKSRKKEQSKDKKIFAPPYATVPKPSTPKEGGEGRPTTEVDTKYKKRDTQEGPKMTDEGDQGRRS